MTKGNKKNSKRRSRALTYKIETIGNFLIELEKQLNLSIDQNQVQKKTMREEYRKFLDNPQKDNLRSSYPHLRRCDVGTLLDETNFLLDAPKDSTCFFIDLMALKHYREEVQRQKELKAAIFAKSKEDTTSKAHRLSRIKLFHKEHPLPFYVLLAELQQRKQNDVEELCTAYSLFSDYYNNGKIFTQENYNETMNMLLHIEQKEVIRNYLHIVQRDVQFAKLGNLYSMPISRKSKSVRCSNEQMFGIYQRVLIIAENEITKSITKDFLFTFLCKDEHELSIPGKDVGRTYFGEVIGIEHSKLQIQCSSELPIKQAYMLIFQPQRLNLRYQFGALELLNKATPALITRLLFPGSINVDNVPQLSLNWRNPKIATNQEQKDAVLSIVDTTPLAAPFIIYGPPGTGKTSTIVEAILQLRTKQPSSKILVTSAPNCACDEIALRLCHALALDTKPRSKEITRIFSWSQEKRRDNIAKLLLEFSNMYNEQFMPDIVTLHNYNIVICTLSTVGKLMTGDFGCNTLTGTNIFTHVFIDEVAAATEAEILIGLSAICRHETNAKVIISGDHQQLGAILNSQQAVALGLNVSLMERLLQRDCYRVDEAGQYNKRILAQLRKNYRAHPAIVELYNGMYYDNKLVPMCSKDISKKWAPNPDFPIIFHSVFGKEERDWYENSLYNADEIDVVLDYVESYIKDLRVDENEIGIISPYRSQYMYIDAELKYYHWYQIETGSPETYRGKEKSIIIASFVRTDSKRTNFLSNPKRINTLISRAKAILVLVGDPRLLCTIGHYKKIIRECQKNKTYYGEAYTIPPDVVEEQDSKVLAEALKVLNIQQAK